MPRQIFSISSPVSKKTSKKTSKCKSAPKASRRTKATKGNDICHDTWTTMVVTAEIHAPPRNYLEDITNCNPNVETTKNVTDSNHTLTLHTGALSMVANDNWTADINKQSIQPARVRIPKLESSVIEDPCIMENNQLPISDPHCKGNANFTEMYEPKLTIASVSEISGSEINVYSLGEDQNALQNKNFTSNLLSGEIDIDEDNSILSFLPMLKAAMANINANDVLQKYPNDQETENSDHIKTGSTKFKNKLPVNVACSSQPHDKGKTITSNTVVVSDIPNKTSEMSSRHSKSDDLNIFCHPPNTNKVDDRVVEWIRSSAEHESKGYSEQVKNDPTSLSKNCQNVRFKVDANESDIMTFDGGRSRMQKPLRTTDNINNSLKRNDVCSTRISTVLNNLDVKVPSLSFGDDHSLDSLPTSYVKPLCSYSREADNIHDSRSPSRLKVSKSIRNSTKVISSQPTIMDEMEQHVNISEQLSNKTCRRVVKANLLPKNINCSVNVGPNLVVDTVDSNLKSTLFQANNMDLVDTSANNHAEKNKSLDAMKSFETRSSKARRKRVKSIKLDSGNPSLRPKDVCHQTENDEKCLQNDSPMSITSIQLSKQAEDIVSKNITINTSANRTKTSKREITRRNKGVKDVNSNNTKTTNTDVNNCSANQNVSGKKSAKHTVAKLSGKSRKSNLKKNAAIKFDTEFDDLYSYCNDVASPSNTIYNSQSDKNVKCIPNTPNAVKYVKVAKRKINNSTRKQKLKETENRSSIFQNDYSNSTNLESNIFAVDPNPSLKLFKDNSNTSGINSEGLFSKWRKSDGISKSLIKHDLISSSITDSSRYNSNNVKSESMPFPSLNEMSSFSSISKQSHSINSIPMCKISNFNYSAPNVPFSSSYKTLSNSGLSIATISIEDDPSEKPNVLRPPKMNLINSDDNFGLSIRHIPNARKRTRQDSPKNLIFIKDKKLCAAAVSQNFPKFNSSQWTTDIKNEKQPNPNSTVSNPFRNISRSIDSPLPSGNKLFRSYNTNYNRSYQQQQHQQFLAPDQINSCFNCSAPQQHQHIRRNGVDYQVVTAQFLVPTNSAPLPYFNQAPPQPLLFPKWEANMFVPNNNNEHNNDYDLDSIC